MRYGEIARKLRQETKALSDTASRLNALGRSTCYYFDFTCDMLKSQAWILRESLNRRFKA